MHVTHLSLYNFRTYQQHSLAVSPATTLFYGPNASGKTSLLESLFFVATTRSPRTTNDHELISWHAPREPGTPPFTRLVADIQRQSVPVRLEVVVQSRLNHDGQSSSPTQKQVRINRKAVRLLDLVGQLRVVLFTPADITLVDGAPAGRRRYLDITLSQLDPHYVRTLAQYQKLVQQRNSLLRAWRDRRRPMRSVDTELGYWDRELSISGGYLLAERFRAVADLNEIVAPIFRDSTGNTQSLTIQYQPSIRCESPTDAAAIAACMEAQLQMLRHDEISRGQTLIGPQRDDLLFLLGGIDLGIYGSRGQQRSVALALKLAEAQLMHRRSGDPPVLLMDDILSELDVQHRTHLLHTIRQSSQQQLLTTTNLNDFDAPFLRHVTCMRVDSGSIIPG